jgi:hypothetical protein
MGQSTGTDAESRLLMFDAATGLPRQSLRQNCGASRAEWHFADQGVVCAMPKGISAWSALAPNSSSRAD